MTIFAALASRSNSMSPLRGRGSSDHGGSTAPLTLWKGIELGEFNNKAFSVASDKDRLNVGPMFMGEGATAFGVSRKRTCLLVAPTVDTNHLIALGPMP